jgi:hypothetical protein
MKRYLYLFQVPQNLPASLEAAASADSDIVFLSWREKSTDPRSIFYPSSSWTQGRNRLLKEVMGRPYHYFIFGDGDVQLELTGPRHAAGPIEQNPWRAFEAFLLEREPAVGFPSYDWHLIGGAHDESAACQTLRYFDALLNAFHHEALPVLLPYYDLLDEASECYSQNLLCSLAAELYPGHAMQTNGVRVINTQALRSDSEFLLSKPENLYLDSLRSPERISKFLRQSYGCSARHPSLGPPLVKKTSYGRKDEELSQIYRLDHPLWARKRELACMPVNAEFFSDAPDTERAQRWRSIRNRGVPPTVTPPLAPPSPPSLIRRFKLGSRPLRTRLGLVRSGRLFIFLRKVAEWRSQRQPRTQWRKWLRHPNLHFEIPESRQLEVVKLLAAALNELHVDSVVYVDVGAALGQVRDLFQRKAGLQKGVFSIGIDPIDVRDHWSYNGYVVGAVSSGDEGFAEFFRYSSSDCSSLKRMEPSSISHDPADIAQGKYFTPVVVERLEETLRVPTFRLDTLIRQYGLANEVLHFVKIDAQGSDLNVFLSLGELTRNCLFLRIETVIPRAGAPARLLYEGQTTFAEDRAAIEAAGFRLLNVSHFGVTPEADVTFVNTKLLRELLPHLAT